MIITLVKADFSTNNIGTLNSFAVLTNFGVGCTYDGPSLVEKSGSFSATITIADNYALTLEGASVTMGGTLLTDALTVVDNIITISIAEVTGTLLITVPTRFDNNVTYMTLTVGGNRVTSFTDGLTWMENTSIDASGNASTMTTYDSFEWLVETDEDFTMYVDEYYAARVTYLAIIHYDSSVGTWTRYRKSQSDVPTASTPLTIHNGDKVYITVTKSRAPFFILQTSKPSETQEVIYTTITSATEGVTAYPGEVLGESDTENTTVGETYTTYSYTVPEDMVGNLYVVAEDDCLYFKVRYGDVYWYRTRYDQGNLQKADSPQQIWPGSVLWVSVKTGADFTLHLCTDNI